MMKYRDQAYRDAYIQKAKAILYQKVEELRSAHPVFIYQAVLDTITTIEFKKSRWMSLQVFKKSSNRLAFPMVDPAWGL